MNADVLKTLESPTQGNTEDLIAPIDFLREKVEHTIAALDARTGMDNTPVDEVLPLVLRKVLSSLVAAQDALSEAGAYLSDYVNSDPATTEEVSA